MLCYRAIGAAAPAVRRRRSAGDRPTSSPAAPARDVDGVERERAVVDERAVRLLLAQRRDPADDVARRALGRGGLGHARLLAACGLGERLEVELPVDRHDPDDERAAVDHGEQRLEHLLRGHPDGRGRLEPEGQLARRVVLVRVERVGDPLALEEGDRGRAGVRGGLRLLGHGPIVPQRAGGAPARVIGGRGPSWGRPRDAGWPPSPGRARSPPRRPTPAHGRRAGWRWSLRRRPAPRPRRR